MFQILSCSSELGNCCSDPGIVILMDNVRKLVVLFQIIIPILLIAFASIDFSKLMMNPEKKGGYKPIINKFLAAAIVFFVPIIMDALIGMMPQSFSFVSCWHQAKTMAESIRSNSYQYLPPHANESNSSGLITDPSDYQKGKPKANVHQNDVSNTNNNLEEIVPGSASGILEGAEKVHTMYEQQGWFYYQDLDQLKWNDINYSTNNPSKATCCATFVGSAFLIGGVFTAAEINQFNYNSQYGISELCEKHKWTKITSYSKLAAGDIVIMSRASGGDSPGHVQIYAGNGLWYNAGSTSSIRRDSPYSSDASSRFLWAWRKPI